MLADCMTKALTSDKHLAACMLLGVAKGELPSDVHDPMYFGSIEIRYRGPFVSIGCNDIPDTEALSRDPVTIQGDVSHLMFFKTHLTYLSLL